MTMCVSYFDLIKHTPFIFEGRATKSDTIRTFDRGTRSNRFRMVTPKVHVTVANTITIESPHIRVCAIIIFIQIDG